MSATTKKKHVTKEVLEDYPLPQGNRQVVKVTAARGNNLHEVETSEGNRFLVSMPSKFRKHVWIKRGDFILVEPIKEGDKVKAEISHILFKDQIKHIQGLGLWPATFTEKASQQDSGMIPQDLLPPSDDDYGEGDLADLCINVNRIAVDESDDSSSCCTEDDEGENDKVVSLKSENQVQKLELPNDSLCKENGVDVR